MNLINFHTFEKNKKYIHENKCMTEGQGLYRSWTIKLFGNGYNEYIFTVEYNSQEYKLYITENQLYEWSIRSKYNECDEEIDSIKFYAYGRINNYNYIVSNGGCDDFDHLFIINYKLKVIDITIKNNRLDVPLITNITSSRKFCNNLDEKYKEIDDIKNYDIEKMITINLHNIVKNYNKNNKYYIVEQYTTNPTIIPFKINNIKEGNNESQYIFESVISYEGLYYETDIIMNDIYDEEEDIISIKICVLGLFGEKYIDFDEYFLIKIKEV